MRTIMIMILMALAFIAGDMMNMPDREPKPTTIWICIEDKSGSKNYHHIIVEDGKAESLEFDYKRSYKVKVFQLNERPWDL